MPKVELVHGDAYEHIGKHGSDVKHVLDIWEVYRESMADFKLIEAMANTRAKVWCWGGTPRVAAATLAESRQMRQAAWG